jgi:hypothetical protein
MFSMLEKSERFQKEFVDYQIRCEKISDEKIKSEIKNLLNKLIFEIRNIDKQHSDLMFSKRIPEFVPESRQKIFDIRKTRKNSLF